MATIGVDFGTAHVRAARVTGGQPEVLRDRSGASAVPAVVAFLRDGVRVGRPAVSHLVTHGDSAVAGVKRWLGRGADDERIRAAASSSGLSVEQGPGGRPLLRLGGEARPPEEVAAALLRHAVDLAEQGFRERPTAATLCAPEWLRDAGRRELARAAESAGLAVQRVVGEGLAMAVALAAAADAHMMRVAIADVGAGGVSAFIGVVGPDGVIELAASGDDTVGGDDVDWHLADGLLDRVLARYPFIPVPSLRAMLRQTFEGMKRDLEHATRATAVLPLPRLPGDGGDANAVELDSARLEAAMGPLLERVEATCTRVLEEAAFPRGCFDSVLLAGGMARSAPVRARVERAFGASGSQPLDLEAVARGAALLAAMEAGAAPPIEVTSADGGLLFPAERPRSRPPDAAAPADSAPPPERPDHAISAPAPASETAQAGRSIEDLAASMLRMAHELRRDAVPPPVPGSAPPVRERSPSSSDLAAPPAETSPPSGLDLGAGSFVRPATPEAVVRLAITRPLEPGDDAPMALPVLLVRGLGRRSVTGVLTLDYGRESLTVNVIQGRALLHKQEHAAVVHAFSWPEGRYTFVQKPLEPDKRKPYSMTSLACEGLRGILRAFLPVELELSLGDMLDLSPVVREERKRVLRKLGMGGGEQRLVEYRLDGTASAREIAAQGGAGKHTTLQLFILMVLWDVAEWRAPVVASGHTLEEQLDERARKMDAQNHFDVLGVHWSSPPAEIEAGYAHVRSELAAGSAWHAAAPGACARMLARAEEAYRVLVDPQRRIAYRAVAYPLDYESITDLMEKRAEALTMRGEEREAASDRAVAFELERTGAGSRKSVLVIPDIVAERPKGTTKPPPSSDEGKKKD